MSSFLFETRSITEPGAKLYWPLTDPWDLSFHLSSTGISDVGCWTSLKLVESEDAGPIDREC